MKRDGHISYEQWIKFPEQVNRIAELEEEYAYQPLHCERCEGSGDCECSDCGHIHPCPECDGSGKTNVGDMIEDEMKAEYLRECKRLDWQWLRWCALCLPPMVSNDALRLAEAARAGW